MYLQISNRIILFSGLLPEYKKEAKYKILRNTEILRKYSLFDALFS